MNDVDVVIPVRNEEAEIEHALSSVKAQTRPARQIIVVDDGSTDRTVANVRAWIAGNPDPHVKLIEQLPTGVSAARNAGIRASDASFVALLDADDLWTPDKLRLQMELMAKGGDRLGVVYCDTLAMTADGRVLPRRGSKPLLRGDIAEQILQRNQIRGSCSAVVVKRRLFEDAGLFDEGLTSGEDWDMWIRLARICTFDYVDEPLVHQRQPRGDAPAHRRHRIEGEFQLIEKMAQNGELTSAAVRSMRRRMAESGMSLADLKHAPDMSAEVRRAFRSFPAVGGWLLGTMNRMLRR